MNFLLVIMSSGLLLLSCTQMDKPSRQPAQANTAEEQIPKLALEGVVLNSRSLRYGKEPLYVNFGKLNENGVHPLKFFYDKNGLLPKIKYSSPSNMHFNPKDGFVYLGQNRVGSSTTHPKQIGYILREAGFDFIFNFWIDEQNKAITFHDFPLEEPESDEEPTRARATAD